MVVSIMIKHLISSLVLTCAIQTLFSTENFNYQEVLDNNIVVSDGPDGLEHCVVCSYEVFRYTGCYTGSGLNAPSPNTWQNFSPREYCYGNDVENTINHIKDQWPRDYKFRNFNCKPVTRPFKPLPNSERKRMIDCQSSCARNNSCKTCCIADYGKNVVYDKAWIEATECCKHDNS